MFKKWLELQNNANWDQLLKALRSPSVQLMYLASQIERMLIGKYNENSIHALQNWKYEFHTENWYETLTFSMSFILL